MPCAFCHQPVARFEAWKSPGGNFYCSEFCAEAESIDPPPRPDVASSVAATAAPGGH
jgi:hypothetical protein